MTAKGQKHIEETKRRISESKRHEKNREPLVAQLCACGCGEYAAVDERRNRVSRYVAGHNSRSNHPMQGKSHTEETKRRLSAYTGEKASSFKHGWSGTPTYKVWSSMHGRCSDTRNNSYKYYGAKGVKVCDRWKSFENFLEDMGERPSMDHQIDRRDPDGDYTPENCRWLTRKENNARKRNGWPARWAKMKDFYN